MTKQGARLEIAGERRTVHRDKRPIGTRAARTNPTRKDVLARAALSPQEQDCMRRRRPRGCLQEPNERRAARFEERRFAAFVKFFLKLRQATPEPLRLDHSMSSQTDLIRCERLGHVVDSAAANRIHSAFDRRVRRDDDHPDIRLTRQNLRQQLDACLGAQPQIQEHHVEVSPVQGRERGAARRDAQHARPGRLETEPQRLAHAGIIVNHESGPGRLGRDQRSGDGLLGCVFHRRSSSLCEVPATGPVAIVCANRVRWIGYV